MKDDSRTVAVRPEVHVGCGCGAGVWLLLVVLAFVYMSEIKGCAVDVVRAARGGEAAR